MSAFAHVASTAILILFQFVYAASTPVRFVTELDLGRRSSGTLYIPLTTTSATPDRRKVFVYPTADAVLTPIPTEIQDFTGNGILDPGRLPMVPGAIPGMEPPVLGVSLPEPVPEPEPPVKPASLSDDSKGPIVRVGGRVVPPQIILQQSPVYPENARRARVQGAVVLNAVVSPEGILQEIRVVSGHPLLVEAALDCIRKWRYRPGTLNEQATEMPITIRVEFVLNLR